MDAMYAIPTFCFCAIITKLVALGTAASMTTTRVNMGSSGTIERYLRPAEIYFSQGKTSYQ